MGSLILKAIVAGVAVLLLAALAIAAAESAAAQWSDNGHGFWQGGGIRGSQEARPPWGDDFSSDDFWGDSCWQVRPIYSRDGAWLDNRRVKVC
jgi:hypothetical protein